MSSRKHHYLPRYYLKGFTDAEDGFFVYDKQKDKIFRSGSIATFYENDLNTVTFSDGRTSDFLEEMYTHVENRVWNSLDNIRTSTNKTNIGFLDKMHLYMFLSFLHWRLPSNIDFVEKLAEVAFDKDDDTLSYFHLVDRDGGQIPEEIINAFRSSPPFRKAVKVLLPFAPFLQDKDWDKSLQNWRFLYSGDHKSWYIVGDNPIITEGQNDHDPVKCLQEFVFPVSGRILLVNTDPPIEKDFPPEIVVKCCLAIIERSSRFVACQNKNFLEALVDLYKPYVRFKKNHLIIPDFSQALRTHMSIFDYYTQR